MKETVAKVLKIISAFLAILGLVIIVLSIVFQAGYFPYVLGGAFVFAAVCAYKTGMDHVNDVFKK